METHLVVTIDTEEDDWGRYADGAWSVRNIGRIRGLQEIFDRRGVVPTYLVTYPVACDREAAALLGGIRKENRCEIGAHLHPWSTPPHEEEKTERNSMLCNLPVGLQRRKIESLTAVIRENMGVAPVSFRCGRWGYGSSVADLLYGTGYKLDSSVTPFTDWTRHFGPDFSDRTPTPFRMRVYRAGDGAGEMLEVPASIGFRRGNFGLMSRVHRTLTGTVLRHLRLSGVLDRMNFINKVWLSPELSDVPEMASLAEAMVRNGYRVLNMFFHSASLLAGQTPFVRSKEDERIFLGRIEAFAEYARESGMRFSKLSDLLPLADGFDLANREFSSPGAEVL
jgi:hypothetical protein